MGKSEIEALMKAGGIPMEDMALFATLGDINDPLWKSNSDPTTQYDAYCGKQPQQTTNSVVYQQQQQQAAATSQQQQQQRQQQQAYSHQQSYTQSYQQSSSSTTAIYHQQYRQHPQQGQSTPNMSSHHMYSNSVPRNGAYSSTPKVGQSQQSWQQAMGGQGNDNVKVSANGNGYCVG